MTRARIFRTAREVSLTLTAVVGALCLLVVVAGLAFGVRPLLFRSGSMAPTIHTGDLSLSRTVDAAGLEPGDIVSVLTPSGTRVTHRVVTNTASGTARQLQLKGDANTTVDNQVYDVETAQKVCVTIPKMGYVVAWFSRAPGSYALALYVALMLMLVVRRRDADPGADIDQGSASSRGGRRRLEEPPREPAGKRRRLRAVAATTIVGAVLASVVVAVSGWGSSTWAAWTDTATVSGTTLASGTWGTPPPVPPAPVITGCTTHNGNTENDITWTWANTTPATLPADTQFKITYSNFTSPGVLPGPATQNLPDNTAPYAGVTVPYNDWTGDFVLTVTTPGGTSVASNKYHFQGKNQNKTCVQVP